jgi:hypothetical protein
VFKEILNLLNEKQGYFYNFYRAAEQKGKIGQKR